MRLEANAVSFSYKENVVLKKVSLSVGPGEFVGIMGPNGSGKTTLLRCMTGFLTPSDGAVAVDGRPVGTYSPREIARLFAVVPQISSTDFPFTAYDIVMMGRIPHSANRLGGYSKDDVAKVREAMDRTDTWQFVDRTFNALSGGERQRVVIARAIAQEPQVLLLDEPTIYLDISGQIEVMDLVKDINRKEGMSVVAVLHDVNLAARYCDRIALLSQGEVEVMGPPADVLTQEVIQAVYGVDVAVRRDPLTNSVYVVPRSVTWRPQRHGTRVHLLCGGGAGGPLMKALSDGGYDVTAGVLNVLDSDFESAKDLRIPVVAEIPFAPIGDESHAENLRMVDEASIVAVSPFPVGPGNFKNLEAAKHALDSGKTVVVVMPADPSSIDFTGGRATDFMKGLISSGAIWVRDPDEAVSALRARRG
jgi:iron complex transport system ATP-binding protein